MLESETLEESPTRWILNVNQRYYHASQLFNGSEKINEEPIDVKTTKMYEINLSLTRFLQNGWSIALDVPVLRGSRTAWKEHNALDTTRYTTRSVGVGDIRVTVYKWLFDITTHQRGNVQVGLGLKLPTGDYRFQDFFNKSTGKVLAPVNYTIQLGDGGTGFTIEVNSFYRFNSIISGYANLFYLVNPRDQNGVSNSFGGTPRLPVLGSPEVIIPPDTIVKYTAHVNSVPDNFTVRAGANFTYRDFIFWTGFRWEGAPVHDLVGYNHGQRRAGDIISVEPGLNYRMKKVLLYLFVTVPIYRNSEQTVPDRHISEAMDIYVASPGGFANCMAFIGAVVKI
jgi:hypothetical protein